MSPTQIVALVVTIRRDFIIQAESGEDIHNPNVQLGLATPIQNQRPDKSQLMETDRALVVTIHHGKRFYQSG